MSAQKPNSQSMTSFVKNYLQLLKLSFLSPRQFANQVESQTSFIDSFIILLLNLFLLLGIQILIETSLIQSFQLIIPAFFDLFILVPLLSVLFLILGSLLHLIAKMLGGNSSMKKTVMTFCYTTMPLILSGVPIIGGLGFLLMIVLLILVFKRVHHYSFLQSIVTIILPFGVIITTLFLMGVLQFSNPFLPLSL